MKQVVRAVSNGELRVVDVPQPEAGVTEVLVATRRSLLSAGTERAVWKLAAASMLQKAKARPDLVRQAVAKARSEGVRSTVAAVRSRLDEDMPLGYSAAGIAVTVGSAVDGVRPGMRVATASAGHAEYQIVPGLLAVPVPDAVSDEAAAFGAVAGIALQGLRQADVGLGGTVAVIGLGLVGQLTTRLALAAGLTVVGIDLRDWAAHLAQSSGATGLVEAGRDTTDRIQDLTRGRGVDAVIVTAATPSSDPVTRATELTRDRGRIVVVGDVGLQLDRRPFYERELELRFARSYGPGRYDRSYEDWAVDYPIGHVRWTEGRNIEAYLDLVAQNRVIVDDLVTHVFDISDAAKAYDALDNGGEALAIQLSYTAEAAENRQPITIRPRRAASTHSLGLIGAGNYAKATFVPALKDAGWIQDLCAITSAKGLSARHLAERHDIGLVMATADDLLALEEIDVVFILSRHDSHAELVVKALDAGKHVFVEKPLAITTEQMAQIRCAYERNDGHVFVGFNRRYADATMRALRVLASGTGALAINYRINAGRLPASHWYKDRRQGGRIVGEVCHFIDLASWITGTGPTTVHAIGSGTGEAAMDEDVTVLLGYPGGSAATITYTTGAHAGTAKERVEILGRGHTIVIDDFRSVTVDGRSQKSLRRGKGHSEALGRFRHDLQSDSSSLEQAYLVSDQSMRATIAVVNELTSRAPGLCLDS